ncbi:MAG: FG-GAP repeat domain-containing protein, partial [Flavobacteriales bacterium]
MDFSNLIVHAEPWQWAALSGSALGLTALLYGWGKDRPAPTWLLALLRFSVLSILGFLLLSPMLRTTTETREAPVLPVVVDATSSQWMGQDSAARRTALDDLVAQVPSWGDGPEWDVDLFTFDRDGGRILVFEKTSDGGWNERPDWSQGWPALKHWVLLRDFDCDGLPDLFTGYQNSIHVYRNTSAGPGVPTFEPYALPLTASWDFGTGAQELPLVCLTIDKPAIFDVDEDGDLDFICFTETSSSLYRFSGQTACGLDLVCTNRCYGMVSEGSEDNTLFIGTDHDCSFNVVDPEGRPAPTEEALNERDGVHAGGAITALQFDGENFHDLLISDVTYPTMSGLMLEDATDGQDSTAWVDMAFPALVPHAGEADSILLERFPAAYPIDPDDDGDWDLVISPNIALEIDDDRCVQLWENQGTTDAPLWALASDHWIQDGTIDVGRGAIPVLHDLDGDGDLDLAVGNKERYEGVNDTPTALALFENTGTATQPTLE